MAETLVLTNPVVPPTPPTLAEYQVIRFLIDKGTNESRLFIAVRSNTGAIVEAQYLGATADSLISALNTANLPVKSLQKRVLERLAQDGFLPAGTVTGNPRLTRYNSIAVRITSMASQTGWTGYTPVNQRTSIGVQRAHGTGSVYDPATKTWQRTGVQKGTDAGQALRALADASGLPLLGSSSSSGAGGMGGGVANLPAITMPDTSAANAAAFGRAKDQAGQTARASLTALRGEMAGRGLRGSGIEAGEVGKTIARGAAGVNEFTREQAIQDAGNAADLAKQEYQGRITQRGQDIGVAQANASRQQNTLQGLLQMIGGRGILY